MSHRIRKAAVIGAGTMGAQIAAHLANAGVPTLLLDLPASEGSDRNAVARAGLQRALQLKPAAFMHADRQRLVAIGNTEDDLERIREADWIVEAIVEDLEAKRALWARLEPFVGSQAIVSSNSSGIPMHRQLEGRSEAFRRRFLGTHFFNPPRYLYLLELIPTPDTDPEALRRMRLFGERILGKGVVIAKDVPGFIANRIGVYGLAQAMRAMLELGLSPDVVDFLTGPLIGRPKSATFRTADLTGLDVLYRVARDLEQATGDPGFALPEVVQRLLERGWLGEKTTQGFYKRVQDESGKRCILTLNLQTLEYEDRGKVRLPELEPIQQLADTAARIRALLRLEGPLGEFMRRTTYGLLHYAARQYGVVSDAIEDIDNALKWGFGWEYGPFELYDLLGLDAVAEVFAALGWEVPPIVQEHLRASRPFYAPAGPSPRPRELILLGALKRNGAAIVRQSAGASLLDIGDGVALLEFHSKANAIGEDALRMVQVALEVVPQHFLGLVIGNQGEHFSAGANLALILMMAQEGDWDELELAVRQFQRASMSLRYAPFPVVAAPFGLTLGGGAEVVLHADRVQAHAELYMGLVETGVGLIPAGGGTKELLFRFSEELAAYPEADPFEAVRRAFQLIALAQTSGSALEARAMGFLRDGDRITMNRYRLITDAKARVLELAPDYMPPAPNRTIRALGAEALGNLYYGAWQLRQAGRITEHELLLARTLAYVLCGGDGSPRTVTEQDILDLEREAFLKLLGTRKTQERIAYTLKTGKPLRN
ncbi:MAG: 3-hydroxyacyl-CoA dehydrogenase NAD-binding domain-containing protein [Bacteroidetes bacterium]|nr:3-hydroxyacyl-CoA dehydrogenase NAD-binding domain-containing protein [Rhodothermia bacterium]MCX7906867.1 3-hydroxyacyl-CoA dehydrogenase NAD-binding domain-containing protein [Bacteroidota bacterium]MDW8285276.1 3-hydroxyacyl-CoA dehydrogenase NAD-binding domain-containing protein [Bacteroidota bacterium]